MLCTAGPGKQVVLPEPAYATSHGVFAAAGATPVFVPLRPEDGFHPRLSDLAAAVTPRTRTVLLDSPHNPTGAVLSPADLDAVADLCRERDLWPVCDEVYAEYAYARPQRSVLATRGRRVVRGLARQPLEVVRDDGLPLRLGRSRPPSLLEEQDVAVTPTDGFGPSAAGHVRISLDVADEHLAQARAGSLGS